MNTIRQTTARFTTIVAFIALSISLLTNVSSGQAITRSLGRLSDGYMILRYDQLLPNDPGFANWPINIPLFNPMMGTLERVEIRFDYHADILAGWENTLCCQAAASPIGGVAMFTFLRTSNPGQYNTILGVQSLMPSVVVSQSLGPFDGILDYIGSSGVTVNFLPHGTYVQSYEAPSLAGFAGLGILDVTVIASAGGWNLPPYFSNSWNFGHLVGGRLQIKYIFK